MKNGVWRSIGRRNQLVLLAIALCLAVAAASGGCYAHRIPGRPTVEDPAVIQSMNGLPLPYTVSVVPWNTDPGEQAGRDPQAYARSLAEVVASSRAFRSSRFETSPGGDADLVAMSMGMRCETSVVPLFTILSAGLIPTVFDGESCDGMVIRSAKPATPPPVEIRVRHKAQTVIGWAAIVFGALPGWSWGTVGDDRGYSDLFRTEIAKSRKEIEQLVTAAALPPPLPAEPAKDAPAP